MNNLIRFTPATDMRQMQREIDRLFESFFPARTQEQEKTGTTLSWKPRVDLSESKEAYYLHLDLPGLTKEDVEINFHEGTLSISGERKVVSEDQKVVHAERVFGNFYRAFTLPQAVDASKIEATFEKGVLSVLIPKAEEVKPHRIAIK